MQIGDLIFKLMGREDPMQALLASMGAGAGGAPGTSTPSGAGTGAGTGAPAAPPQPAAYTPPADTAQLMMNVLQRQQQNDQINRSLGLIAMGLSKRENKAGIAAMMGGGGGGSGDFLNNVLEIQNSMAARAQKQAARGNAASIGKKYGLDEATSLYLFDTGKLDSIIAEAEKPNRQIADMGDGTKGLIDLTTGDTIGTFGVKKPREIVMEDDGNGGKVALYKDTMERVGKERDLPGTGATTDQQDFAAGEKNPAFRKYEMEKTKAGATTINTGEEGPGVSSKKFLEKSGEYFAEDWQNLRKGRGNARQMIQSFDAVEKALNEGGFRTGFAGDAELSARKALQAMGFDQDAKSLAGAELVQAFGNRMSALMRNPESGMGMPGSVSDRDLQFLKESNVGLTNTEQGNKTMVQVFKRFEQRKIDIANMADEYVKKNGQLDAGFDEVVQKFAAENSILDGIDLSAEEPSIDERLQKYKVK